MRSTFSASMSALWLFSALAMAVASTLPTGLPRTMSATRRHFCGEMRAFLSLAATCMALLRGRALVARVTPEGTRRGEFAELVADHVLGHEHGDVLLAVVHGNRQADHVRQDHGAARPGLDRAAIVLLRSRGHLLRKVGIDERAFLH